MSAWIVSEKHIDAMINSMGNSKTVYWDDNELSFHKDRNRIGQALVSQNYRSVNYRYGEEETPPDYSFTPCYPHTPVQILKACDCYDYQSCETDDYETTLAHRIVQAIRSDAINSLPGYEEAPWGID